MKVTLPAILYALNTNFKMYNIDMFQYLQMYKLLLHLKETRQLIHRAK